MRIRVEVRVEVRLWAHDCIVLIFSYFPNFIQDTKLNFRWCLTHRSEITTSFIS